MLIPRWLDAAPEPDLVTVFFGGNDWDAGMRGQEFEAACADAVDRVRRATKGKADVLLLTTSPSAAAWDETAELAEACGRRRRTGTPAWPTWRRRSGRSAPGRGAKLFVADRVHLSPAGHALVAETVLKAIGVVR